MTQSVPAHRTVLLHEAVDALAVRPDGVYVDGTFGRGGHSRLLLSRLGPQGRLIALDRDPAAHAAAAQMPEFAGDARFSLQHAHFSEIDTVLGGLGVSAVDGVLLDIGVSSPQIDQAERGFSFRADGPLDMRMDTTRGETAADWLAQADEREIAEVIRDYGEERFAFQIAKKIVSARQQQRIGRTGELAALVAQAVRTREPGQDPATRTFQAIRIFINQELAELSVVLPKAVSLLAPKGRLAVIAFHSLEDRIVKHFMRDGASRDHLPKHVPVRDADLPPPTLKVIGKAVKPSPEEVSANPRARSAVLRVAEKC